MEIVKEGITRAVFFIVLAVVLFFVSGVTGGFIRTLFQLFLLILVLLACFTLYFFRDPEREHPEGDDIIISPADGKVIEVEKHDGGINIKIFMSPLDVHVQRSPVSGMIESVKYTPGKFKSAYNPQVGLVNERNSIVIMDDKLREYEVLQIAGVLARRISCWISPGRRVSRGERLGMIMLGSQVNIKMPSEVRLQVEKGGRVKAGETVLGSFLKG